MEITNNDYYNPKNNMTITSLLAKIDQINAWERDFKSYNNDYMAEKNAAHYKEITSLINIIILSFICLAYNLFVHTTFMFITCICVMTYTLFYIIATWIPIHNSFKKLKDHVKSHDNFLFSLVGSTTFDIKIDAIVNIMTMETLYYEVYVNIGLGYQHVGNINNIEDLNVSHFDKSSNEISDIY